MERLDVGEEEESLPDRILESTGGDGEGFGSVGD